MATETYNLTAFLNDLASETALTAAVEADAGITTALDGVSQDEDAATVTFHFPTALAGGEKTALDALVAAHDGAAPTQLKFHAASKLIEGELTVTQDATWQTLGGVVTTPDFFMATLAAGLGRIVGSYKSVGTAPEIRIIEDDTTTLCTFSAVATADVWTMMQFFTTTPPTAGTHEYKIEGRLNGATSMSVRFTSMSLLEAV
jgi:hypothetical protein